MSNSSLSSSNVIARQMQGATSNSVGVAGTVPTPPVLVTGQSLFLKSDATWSLPLDSIVLKSGNYTATSSDRWIECNVPASTSMVVSLPSTLAVGQQIGIIYSSGTASSHLFVSGAGINLVDNSANIVTGFELTSQQSTLAVVRGNYRWQLV